MPQHIINLKFDDIAILFILELLKTLQYDNFPTKIDFTKTVNKALGQTLKRVTIYIYRGLSCGQLCVAFSRCSSFDVTVAVTEENRQYIEKD
jgi:p-aminobenzoyl-glutamate transporter AbgT